MPLKPADVQGMADRHAEAWSSHTPDAVAWSFYDELPDLVVRLDTIRAAGNRAVFMWTLEGTHSGTGNSVSVSGWEAWRLSDDVRVIESDGRFDAAGYERQITEGI